MLVLGPPTLDAYDPNTNTWQPIPIGGPNEFAVVAWTGREAIVWGGVCCGDRSNNGTAYDPSANAWSPLPTAPLQPRRSPMGAWTGKELIVAGGWTFRSDATLRVFRNAAAYNPGDHPLAAAARHEIPPQLVRGRVDRPPGPGLGRLSCRHRIRLPGHRDATG
jgi:hypothetical protein